MNFALSAPTDRKKNIAVEFAIIETIRLTICDRSGKHDVCL